MSQPQGTCVLVVEDDPCIATCLTELLQSEGYSVCVARDGQEGLDMLRQTHLPDLILLDLQMPIKDGVAFRREQRADPRMRAIPTLVMSADVLNKQDGFLFESCAHVAKPLDIYRLLTVVARRLS